MCNGHIVVALSDYVCVSSCCHVKLCILLCGNCSFVWLLMHSRPCRLTVHRAVQHHSAGWLFQRPESSGLRPQPWQKATTCQSEAPRWYVGGFWGATHFFICPPAQAQLKNHLYLRWHWHWPYNKFASSVIEGRRNLDPIHTSICIPSQCNKYYLFMLIPSWSPTYSPATSIYSTFIFFPGFWPVGVRTKEDDPWSGKMQWSLDSNLGNQGWGSCSAKSGKMIWKETGGRDERFYTDFISKWPERGCGGEIRVVCGAILW